MKLTTELLLWSNNPLGIISERVKAGFAVYNLWDFKVYGYIIVTFAESV